MDQHEALKSYTELMREIALFEAVHEEVVRAHKNLVERAVEVEAELKAATRETGEGIENRYFEVKLTPKERRWYDPDTLVSAYPPAETMPGVVNVSIDREIVDRLVRHGNIPAEAAEIAVRTEPMTPAVFVRPRQNVLGEKAVRRARKAVGKVTVAK